MKQNTPSAPAEQVEAPPARGEDHKQEPQDERLVWWAAGWIAAAVGAGIVLAAGLLWLYQAACVGRRFGVCKMAVDNPPWLLLTGVIAAPAILLTWYWRTTQKHAEIGKGWAEVAQGKADLAHATAVFEAERAKAKLSHDLATAAHLTERFARAIELLGSERPAIRLGGIYSLERLAKDSLTDRSTIIETLAGFVRMTSPHDPNELDPESEEFAGGTEHVSAPGEDVRAAVVVLGRRAVSEEDRPIDLRRANLREVLMAEASFQRANFGEAFLYRARLGGADFREANFADAHLAKAWLVYAKMTKARLRSADLSGATLDDVDLAEASLGGVNLIGACCIRAKMTGAKMQEAVLVRTILKGADLTGANLTGADLSSANLRMANLAGANLKGAKLRGADMGAAILEGANLTGADLTKANLEACSLSNANMTDVVLAGAELVCAQLKGTNVSRDTLNSALRDGVPVALSAEEFGRLLNGARMV